MAIAITKYTDIEAVRTRPGMWVGDPNEGAHILLTELLKWFSEPFSLVCLVKATIHKSGALEIIFDENSLPLDGLPEEKKYWPESSLTSLHAGCGYALSFEVLTALNALSAWFELDLCDGQQRYQQRFEVGIPGAPVVAPLPNELPYTRLFFLPDLSILAPMTAPGRQEIYSRLRELSFLMPGLEIFFEDQLAGTRERLYSPGGLVGRLDELIAQQKTYLQRPLLMSGVVDGVNVKLALQWVDAREPRVEAYTNGVKNRDGGTHVAGLYHGLCRALSWPLPANDSLTTEQVTQGLHSARQNNR